MQGDDLRRTRGDLSCSPLRGRAATPLRLLCAVYFQLLCGVHTLRGPVDRYLLLPGDAGADARSNPNTHSNSYTRAADDHGCTRTIARTNHASPDAGSAADARSDANFADPCPAPCSHRAVRRWAAVLGAAAGRMLSSSRAL